MCELCDKVDFTIDTIEQLIPAKEWQALCIKVATEAEFPPEAIELISKDVGNVWMNVTAKLCARMMFKHQVPMMFALNTIGQHLQDEYFRGHESQDALKERLKDYDS